MKFKRFVLFTNVLLFAILFSIGLNPAHAASFNIVYSSVTCDFASSTITTVGTTTLSTTTDTFSEIYVNGNFVAEIVHKASPPLTTLTFVMPLGSYITLHQGDKVTVTNLPGISSVSTICGETSNVTAVNAWGVINARAVEWQFQAADGQWYWVVDSNFDPIQTPIEYRDVKQNNVLIPHYALSSLVIEVGGAAPEDVTKYRVYDADTHEMFHQIWIQIANSSVFIP